ncbi:hypothetical protein [Inhella sp.]|uniref:hypothetical protein n=1 Tax=Inhella sp. TaxID=1921806 RepID=UPI0035B03A68
MKRKTTLLMSVLLGTMGATTPIASHAQYYGYTGPGTTTRSGVPMQTYVPPLVREFRDPTQTWQYRAAERALPYVHGTRQCAFGALSGGAMGFARGKPAVGMVTGCAGALSPNFSIYRPQNAW